MLDPRIIVGFDRFLRPGLMLRQSAIALFEYEFLAALSSLSAVKDIIYLNAVGEVRWYRTPSRIGKPYEALPGENSFPISEVHRALTERILITTEGPNEQSFIVPLGDEEKSLGALLLRVDPVQRDDIRKLISRFPSPPKIKPIPIFKFENLELEISHSEEGGIKLTLINRRKPRFVWGQSNISSNVAFRLASPEGKVLFKVPPNGDEFTPLYRGPHCITPFQKTHINIGPGRSVSEVIAIELIRKAFARLSDSPWKSVSIDGMRLQARWGKNVISNELTISDANGRAADGGTAK